MQCILLLRYLQHRPVRQNWGLPRYGPGLHLLRLLLGGWVQPKRMRGWYILSGRNWRDWLSHGHVEPRQIAFMHRLHCGHVEQRRIAFVHRLHCGHMEQRRIVSVHQLRSGQVEPQPAQHIHRRVRILRCGHVEQRRIVCVHRLRCGHMEQRRRIAFVHQLRFGQVQSQPAQHIHRRVRILRTGPVQQQRRAIV